LPLETREDEAVPDEAPGRRERLTLEAFDPVAQAKIEV
jgi:hypothetical protein